MPSFEIPLAGMRSQQYVEQMYGDEKAEVANRALSEIKAQLLGGEHKNRQGTLTLHNRSAGEGNMTLALKGGFRTAMRNFFFRGSEMGRREDTNKVLKRLLENGGHEKGLKALNRLTQGRNDVRLSAQDVRKVLRNVSSAKPPSVSRQRPASKAQPALLGRAKEGKLHHARRANPQPRPELAAQPALAEEPAQVPRQDQPRLMEWRGMTQNDRDHVDSMTQNDRDYVRLQSMQKQLRELTAEHRKAGGAEIDPLRQAFRELLTESREKGENFGGADVPRLRDLGGAGFVTDPKSKTMERELQVYQRAITNMTEIMTELRANESRATEVAQQPAIAIMTDLPANESRATEVAQQPGNIGKD